MSSLEGKKSFWFQSLPIGVESFGIGCHFYRQNLSAACSADDVATWVAMRPNGKPHPSKNLALCVQ
jgi:hypothetical protein